MSGKQNPCRFHRSHIDLCTRAIAINPGGEIASKLQADYTLVATLLLLQILTLYQAQNGVIFGEICEK